MDPPRQGGPTQEDLHRRTYTGGPTQEDLQGDLLCQQRVLFFTFDGAQVLLLS
jgi:hypothetical protein